MFVVAYIGNGHLDDFSQQVDPEAMQSSSLVLSWLRLVQAARSREEQNTEAYLKAGQLYVRTTRDIRHEEELLVWYDHELSHLLGFTEMAATEPAAGERMCRILHHNGIFIFKSMKGLR